MLESVLMRAFLMIYLSDFETGDTDDDERSDSDSDDSVHPGKSKECRAFTVLSSVCWSWRQTLTSWPGSPTGHLVRHRLRKLIESE